jgi:hypothetical protein
MMVSPSLQETAKGYGFRNMKAEYKEGPEARENFKRGMRALFQVPKKQTTKAKRQPKKATARKTSGKTRG